MQQNRYSPLFQEPKKLKFKECKDFPLCQAPQAPKLPGNAQNYKGFFDKCKDIRKSNENLVSHYTTIARLAILFRATPPTARQASEASFFCDTPLVGPVFGLR